MSGYIRGGVQMAYKATPTPTPATSTANYASSSQYYQGQAAAYGHHGGTYSVGYAQRMQTLRDDYERECAFLAVGSLSDEVSF